MSAARPRLFGTDGVRGTANVWPMTAEVALQLGQAVAHIFRGGRGSHRILIGKDTRLSGYMFEDALAAGICSMGVNVIQVGPMPTPAMAFLTRDMRCDAGVMISASHNPFEDNGLKVFGADGMKIPDTVEARIEAFNAVNWFIYGNPNTVLSNSTFGQITTLGAAPRVLQFAAKYVF